MQSALELRETPQAQNTVMLLGFRQWADAGSISSALPRYLMERTRSRKIGKLSNDGFYLFQFPGTHDLVRPVVRFENGFPTQLDLSQNEFFYGSVGDTSVVYFIGDEPHLDVERYANSILDAAQALNVKRIIGFFRCVIWAWILEIDQSSGKSCRHSIGSEVQYLILLFYHQFILSHLACAPVLLATAAGWSAI